MEYMESAHVAINDLARGDMVSLGAAVTSLP